MCPRLSEFRSLNRVQYPDFHNAPVPAFGPLDSEILIVGLAPGLKGANRTARPFTGDWAGDLLYPTLCEFALAQGVYGANPNDGLTLCNCRITNAVRCVPPQNKVTAHEVRNCGVFLRHEIAAMPNLRAILALGGVAHGGVLAALGYKKSAYRFAHNARHRLTPDLFLLDSYHCSRYNTNTGRLTAKMFRDVFKTLTTYIAPAP
ncbi:uracil-DNA glycosylase [Varunaivibrio sulfuroxidans]|nr:uracil-DNA glycosylase [Varunaivibrio sulfuroxidans]